MNLRTKFSLYNTLSRVLLLVLLVGVLPPIMSRVALLATDQRLGQKKEKVQRIIERQGISAFLEGGETSYGSYNLLKEEFISLEEIQPGPNINIIENSRRAVEDEIVEYRVLSHSFTHQGRHYLLEIGRSIDSIGETEKNFRTYALYLLVVVGLLTTLADLAVFRYLLEPLGRIIRQRLTNVHHPASFDLTPVPTSTDDFHRLDESIRAMMLTIRESFEKERKFIAEASHELLTPLAVLQYRFDNMLTDESLSDENLLKIMESQRTLHRLRGIIKSLLLISKVENDQFEREDTVAVAQLLEEVSEEIQDRLQVHGLTLHRQISDDYVLSHANRGLLFTMLFNLVNNAVKYNRPDGQIFLVGEMRRGRYVLEVRDTGVGIGKEQLPHLFEPFHKGKAADQDSFGLGLSIVKTIATRHGIELEVNSIPGLGTSFSLLFPVAAEVKVA